MVRIIITNNEKDIGIIKDLTDLENNTGLMGQIMMELEILKEEILSMYYGDGDDEDI
jgi:hypothetical protein